MAKGSIHDGQPWRGVVYIDEQRGSRGGITWCLTLDCGHHAFRPVPPFKMHDARHYFNKPRCAPQRVRCIFCPTEDERQAIREKREAARETVEAVRKQVAEGRRSP